MTETRPTATERASYIARSHPRYELTAFVDLRGVEQLPHQRVQNISLGGVCIHTPAQEPPGTVVELVIFFPDLDVTFEAEGEVVWVSQDSRMDMGVRFRNLDAERQAILQRYLSELGRGQSA